MQHLKTITIFLGTLLTSSISFGHSCYEDIEDYRRSNSFDAARTLSRLTNAPVEISIKGGRDRFQFAGHNLTSNQLLILANHATLIDEKAKAANQPLNPAQLYLAVAPVEVRNNLYPISDTIKTLTMTIVSRKENNDVSFASYNNGSRSLILRTEGLKSSREAAWTREQQEANACTNSELLIQTSGISTTAI